MALSCSIHPKAPGTNNVSKLFKDLLTLTSYNRELTKTIYFKSQDPAFNQKYEKKIKRDENGEPTIGSLLSLGLKDYIPLETVAKKTAIEEGFSSKDNLPVEKPNTPYTITSLMDKVKKFNTESDLKEHLTAVVNYRINENKERVAWVELKPRTQETLQDYQKAVVLDNLTQRLLSVLEEAGVSVGALTELEERMGINGVTDFSRLQDATSGIVQLIRLAKGEKGLKALPEEFSHFAIAALEKNPIVQRLVSLIENSNLAQEILGKEYDQYSMLYKGNARKLAVEAAGKLVSKYIERSERPSNNKPYKTLLQRVLDAIKQFFGKLDIFKFYAALRQSEEAASTLAQKLLEGDLTRQLALKEVQDRGVYYQIGEEERQVSKEAEVLDKIIKNEARRLKINEKLRFENSLEQEDKLHYLLEGLKNHQEQESILQFLTDTYKEMKTYSENITDSILNSDDPLPVKAKKLLEVKSFCDSYSFIVNDIYKNLKDQYKNSDDENAKNIIKLVRGCNSVIKDLQLDFESALRPVMKEWLGAYWEDFTFESGKYKGKTITLDMVLDESLDGDISLKQKLLDAMADSGNLFLQLGDIAIKYKLEERKRKSIALEKKIKAAAVKLEQAGIKDQSWMIERDAEGKSTGYYVSEYNMGEYKRQEALMYEELKKKYGENPAGAQLKAKLRERDNWYAANGTREKPNGKYKNPVYEEIKNDAVKREFYDTVINIKKDMEDLLPVSEREVMRTVKIRKDMLERIKSSDSLSSLWKNMKQEAKDAVIKREDDDKEGVKATLLNFNNEEIRVVPIYFTTVDPNLTLSDYSEDVVSTMIAYVNMAESYNSLSEVADLYLLGKEYLASGQMKIEAKSGGKTKQEFLNFFGIHYEQPQLVNPTESNIYKRWISYGDMNIFGRKKIEEGTFGKSKISISKTSDLLIKITALNRLGFNISSNISNLTTGFSQMVTEAISKRYFSMSDYVTADGIYISSIPSILAEAQSRVKTSKLNLFLEKFDVVQDYEKRISETEWDKKNKLVRLFGDGFPLLGQEMGEHYMQTRTALAVANTIKFKSPEGEVVSLWDAYEVKYIDPNNTALGATLELKKGYTKEDGTAFTEKDETAFILKASRINKNMHGIYNQVDKSAVNQYAAGRMVLLYRRWIVPAINRRYSSLHYDLETKTEEEGYYRSFGRFLLNTTKGLKSGQVNIAANWNNMSDMEKANCKKSITELLTASLLALTIFYAYGADDKERKKHWLKAMSEYQIRRLYAEIGTMTPSPAMLSEGLKILKSPSACVQSLQSCLDTIDLLNLYNYEWFNGEEAILQRGAYKGWSKASKTSFEMLPFVRTVNHQIHIEDQLQFFK